MPGDLVFVRQQPFLGNSQVSVLAEKVLQELHHGRDRMLQGPVEDGAEAHRTPDDLGEAECRVAQKLGDLAAQRGIGESFEKRVQVLTHSSPANAGGLCRGCRPRSSPANRQAQAGGR